MSVNTKSVGDLTEAAVTLALLKDNKVVLKPVGDNQRYDLVTHDGSTFLKIQCKTGRLRNGAIAFATCSSYAHRGGVRKGYGGEADLFGVYCPDLDSVYLVPVDIVGTSQCLLRVTPPKKGIQREGRLASTYQIKSTSLMDGFNQTLKNQPNKPLKRVTLTCLGCQAPFSVAPSSGHREYCSTSCFNVKRQRTVWPETQVLKDLVWMKPVTVIADELNVSGVAVKKRCKRLGIPTPPRGYWSKT